MIAPWAAAYVGIPFQTGGRTHAGADCWGALWIVYREVFRIDLPSYDDEYTSVRDGAVLGALTTRHIPELPWTPVEAAAIVPGDALLFRMAGWPMHVGVAVGDGRFLHVLSAITASCIERLDAPMWRRRFLGAYRYGR